MQLSARGDVTITQLTPSDNPYVKCLRRKMLEENRFTNGVHSSEFGDETGLISFPDRKRIREFDFPDTRSKIPVPFLREFAEKDQ